jgi:hypothetical protein
MQNKKRTKMFFKSKMRLSEITKWIIQSAIVLAFTLLNLIFLNAAHSNAITFGKDVLDGSTKYPSVVSVWYAEDPEEDYYPICTGTLIESRIVLTAAHCVLNEGIYAVGFGSDLLKNAKLQSVSATWKNPSYSAKQMVNDVGLLLLEKSIPWVTPTSLATSKEISSIVANKKVKFEIVGWGDNQNEEPATYLRMAVVEDQSAIMKKSKRWRNDVWIAVGKYNKKEKVYAGACNGDSGGPLFATANGITVLAGVTSWGAEDCEYGAPSIYVRLSYYIKQIQTEGIPTLLKNETVQNRAAPSVLTEPRIIGTAKTGQILTCDKGVWSANTTNVKFYWSGLGIILGKHNNTSSSITVGENTTNGAIDFTCTVIGENNNGRVQRDISVKQAAKPQLLGSPSISGMPSAATTTTTSLRCSAGTFTGATSVNQEWWIGDSYSPNSKIASGNDYSIGQSFFTNYGGKTLYCLSLATGDGGVTNANSRGVSIPAFLKPEIQNFPTISGFKEWQSPAINTVATCSGWTWKNSVTQEVIEWYSNTSYNLSGASKVGTGSTLTLTENFLTNYKSKYLMCAVAGTNLGGTTTMYSGLYLYYYQSSNTSPTPSATPTPTPTQSSSTGSSPTPAPSPSSVRVKPNTVQNFEGSIGSTGVQLTWKIPVSNDAQIDAYVVERLDNREFPSAGGGEWKVLATVRELKYFVPENNPCYRSNYRVKAISANLSSEYSPTLEGLDSPRCRTILDKILTSNLVSIPNGFSFQLLEFDNTQFDWRIQLFSSPGRYLSPSATGIVTENQLSPGSKVRIWVYKISRSSGEYLGLQIFDVTSG